jgi:uncharacterized RDD family membrane protein YckC
LNTSPQTAEVAAISDDLPAWKQEVNARLSAHRTRRSEAGSQQPTLPGMESPAPAARAARVAARVAERYAKAPTYRDVLAVEAAKAARAAEAAAYAACEAHQAAQAVTEVLRDRADSECNIETEREASELRAEIAPTSDPQTVQYHVNPASLPVARRNSCSESQVELRSAVDPYPHVVDPFEEALVAPAQPLPARVLEFPRELVAARKARPRIAEGPLYENAAAPEGAQLRIFEVEPEAISHQPVTVLSRGEDAILPEWSSIRLDATPRNEEISAVSGTEEVSMHAGRSVPDSRNMPFSSRAGSQAASKKRSVSHKSSLAEMLPLHVASIGDRLMAAIVDAALVFCAFLLFILVFAACTAHPPTGKPAIVAAAAALASFAALYQWLFFTYAESTPGMRYARIALCTFGDENPDRKTLQMRIGALFFAALPLGLGFLWVFFDDDRLGWHDRITRTYQRSYR